MAAAYQLKSLADKFNFADAAGPQLDIVHAVVAPQFLGNLRL